MLFLLALPIFLAVAAAHRYLTLYAPSNILIRRVRMSPSRWRTVGALAVLASVLLLAVRTVEVAITAGAPGWLNLVALVLAWDALRVSAMTIHTVIRGVVRSVRRRTNQTGPGCSSPPCVQNLVRGDRRPLGSHQAVVAVAGSEVQRPPRPPALVDAGQQPGLRGLRLPWPILGLMCWPFLGEFRGTLRPTVAICSSGSSDPGSWRHKQRRHGTHGGVGGPLRHPSQHDAVSETEANVEAPA
jgi:hypothetical protein